MTEATRTALTRERVLRAGVALADAEGIEAVTMRRLGQEVGVEAMSLYHHVPNKGALMDGMVDVVVDELNAAVSSVSTPETGPSWQGALRARILRAREVMVDHPWVPRLLEQRASIGVGLAIYYDGALAIMRAGGFSNDLAHKALHALGSRLLGFTQELFAPDGMASDADAAELMAQVAPLAPHLVGMFAEIAHEHGDSTLGWCDDQAEFEFGLDLLLSGLERSVRRGEE